MIARLHEPGPENSTENAALPVLRSRLIAEVPSVVHGLTRRVVGLGAAEGNVGFSSPRDRDEAWLMRRHWSDSIGTEPEVLVTVHQVHGDAVTVATREDAGRGAMPGSRPLAEADAIITAEIGVALMTLHADCLPLLLCDPEVPVVATIHAGWRGTVVGVAARTVQAMVTTFQAEPARTIAYLGPANRGCCYEVGDEVANAWLRYDPLDAAGALARRGNRWHFDIAAANRWTLLGAGLQADNIEISDLCTQCVSDHWFSHRAQGPLTGRFGAVIGLR